MADQQPLNATFFAFRKREQGGVLLRTTIAFVIATVLLYAAFAAIFFAQLGPLITWYADVIGAVAKDDTTAIQGMGFPPGLGALALGGFVLLFLFFVLFAAFEAACLKWMIHGETGGFMGLTLGADTWRVYFTYWIWFVLYLAFSIVMGIVMATVLGTVTISSGGDPTAVLMTMPFFYLLQYAVMIYFAVRFAPAAATSVALHKFSFFKAWTATKGRFWALFGSFFILCLIYLVWIIVFMTIWVVAVAGPSIPDLSNVGTDPQQMYRTYMEFMQSYIRSLAEPRTWVVMALMQIVSWVVALAFYVAMFGINARAAQAALAEGKIKPA
jgi:hypothetical protein